MNLILLKVESVWNPCSQLAMINCTVMFLLFPGTASAIDIEEVIWGFGNQIVKQECVPLSLHLSNNSPEPFDELIQLNRLQHTNSRIGAPLYRKVYIAPYSSKWVQFYPYIIERGQNEWSLNWGEPHYLSKRKITNFRSHIELDENEAEDRTRVVLSGVNDLSRGGSQFRQFPENLFPAYVTGTDSLDEAILNHLPQWESTRRNSFMDWLYRGGILHLFPDSTGNNLEFSASMAELNVPLDHFRVGAGLVVRHQGDLNKFTINRLVAALDKVHSEEVSAIEVDQAAVNIKTDLHSQNNYSQYIEDVNARVLRQLSNMTRPEHNWALIYLMTCLYIFIIFPGCLIFGMQQKGYRNTLLFLLTTVALFSSIFWTIGKRGYGETTPMNSLAVVRPLKGGFCDVTCWNNSFVTDGAEYQFSAKGAGVIFTTAQDLEKIRGGISNGIGGKFLTDIPPFSDRRFLYRIKAPYPKTGFQVDSYSLTEKSKLSSLTIGLKSDLPENISKMQVLYNRNLYDLKREQMQDSQVLVLGKSLTSISKWQSIFEDDLFFTNPHWNQTDEREAAEIYESSYTPLVMHSVNINNLTQLNDYQADLSRIQLFIYCDIPDELKMKTDVQGLQQGRALFVMDLPLPEKKIDPKNE